MALSKKLHGEIKGDLRKRTYFLAKYEVRLIDKLAPLVPSFIETYHLTLFAIPAAILMVFFGHLALENKIWLLGVAAMVELHFITDMLDGEIGRRRDTGLVRWGYYADHFLDLFFGASLFLAYTLAFPELYLYNFGLLTSLSLFFLDTQTFPLVHETYSTSGFLGKISPTEMTQVVFLLTISMIYLPVDFIKIIFMAMAGICIAAVFIHAYVHSKKLWKKDMEIKDKKVEQEKMN